MVTFIIANDLDISNIKSALNRYAYSPVVK